MKEIEILAKSAEEALARAVEKNGIEPGSHEVTDEFEPDEADLKQYKEETGEDATVDNITLYVLKPSLDKYIKLAEEWTQGLIERFAPGGKAFGSRFQDIVFVRLEVPDNSILIGKKGATLDALQHVVVRALLTQDEEFPDVMLDVEGYREKKMQRLEREANRAAEKAHRTGRRVPLPPMSPAERKFIHKLLKSMGDIKTESRGQNEGRHIVVESTNPKPASAPERREHSEGGGGAKRGRGGNRGGGGGGGGANRDGNREGGGQQRQGGQKQGGRGRGGKQHGYRHENDKAGENRGLGITDEQRRLLYGDYSAKPNSPAPDDSKFEDKDGSLLPEYDMKKGWEHDDEGDDQLVDKIE